MYDVRTHVAHENMMFVSELMLHKNVTYVTHEFAIIFCPN